MSSADILQSMITLLNSPRSNDDIQNDLFELLGFDKFEFIEEILQHRQQITDSLRPPPSQPTIAESKLKTFNILFCDFLNLNGTTS